jgi:hypothetical protein
VRNKYLNAVWWYYHENESNEEARKTCKKVFELILAGRCDEAEQIARTNHATWEIWQKAKGECNE